MKTLTREFTRLMSGRFPGDWDRKISLVRLLILFALLPILWWDAVSPETEIVLIGLSALIALYILLALLVLPRMRRALRRDLFLTIDILAITALVWFTGGIRSTLLFLFYLPILAAAIRLDLVQALLSAIAVSGIVTGIWKATEGALPSFGSATLRVGMFAGSSLVLALFFSILAAESRLMRERANQNQQLSDKLAEATEQLRRRLSELEFAYDLSRKLAGTTEIQAVLVLAAEAARQLLRAPYGGVFVSDHIGGEMVAAHTAGVNDREAALILEACSQRVTKDSLDPVPVQVDPDGVWTRAICAPIVVGDRLLGVLCAGGDGQWEPARHSVAILGQVASQAGIALDRATLLEELQRLAAAKPEARVFDQQQFERILRHEISRASQSGAPFALLKLALYNVTNSEHSDQTMADLAASRFAYLVLNAVRRADIIAQTSRGEMFVLLSMANLAAAGKFAARLFDQVSTDATMAQIFDSTAAPDVRAGIAMFPEDAVTAAELAFAAQNAFDSADANRSVVYAHELEGMQA
jgi:GGDEF domain-containing protein